MQIVTGKNRTNLTQTENIYSFFISSKKRLWCDWNKTERKITPNLPNSNLKEQLEKPKMCNCKSKPNSIIHRSAAQISTILFLLFCTHDKTMTYILLYTDCYTYDFLLDTGFSCVVWLGAVGISFAFVNLLHSGLTFFLKHLTLSYTVVRHLFPCSECMCWAR